MTSSYKYRIWELRNVSLEFGHWLLKIGITSSGESHLASGERRKSPLLQRVTLITEEWRRKPLYPPFHLDLISVICFDKPCKSVSRNQVGNTGIFFFRSFQHMYGFFLPLEPILTWLHSNAVLASFTLECRRIKISCFWLRKGPS